MKIAHSLGVIFVELEKHITKCEGNTRFRLNLNACKAGKKTIGFVYWSKNSENYKLVSFNRKTEEFSQPSFWSKGQI